ncbi:MAG: hypothetical protein KatS3mg102_0858 [Planctomycetota bacterium]|nr:MAG: hypothetical protein KatS3mg102_0858 [Planctomycetota bacterium]
MTFDPLAFVRQHGVVLASARGPVPSVAAAVAGEPIRGSWWAHPRGHQIFAALRALGDSPEVVCLRLIGGKRTLVHRRLWPALVRLAEILGPERLTAVREEHTASGAHRNVLTPFPAWVPPEVEAAARGLDEAQAWEQLGPWAPEALAPRPRAPRRQTGRRPGPRGRPRR